MIVTDYFYLGSLKVKLLFTSPSMSNSILDYPSIYLAQWHMHKNNFQLV